MPERQSLKIRRRLTSLHAHPQYPVLLKIVRRLEKEGYQAVLAGGCVRDSWLGRPPKDLDVATSAPPIAVESLFTRTLAVGKAFGTIVVVEEGHSFEVTTFRSEGPYKDGRHPSHVNFTNMGEDASRRDFTINALFYDPVKTETLDFVGGIADLEGGILRTVGSPGERFDEDRLRMLRAARFVGQLGFALDVRALAAIASRAEAIKSISAERILAEMQKLLQSPYLTQGLNVLRQSKLGEFVWPEIASVNLSRVHDFFVFTGWENAFAALMWLAAAGLETENRLRAWKSSRDSIQKVHAQIEGCRTLLDPQTKTAARMKILGSPEVAEILVLASGAAPEKIDQLQKWIREFLDLAGPGAVLPPPLVSGQDLLNTGMPPGENMGRVLKSLYEEQLEGRLSSKAEALKKLNPHR
jgi:tRNA nucleotidyltransferase/poly(A) polymerase